ncbi:MAG: hypothetical protein FJ304_14250 [Planctomycetes bacterium]|nr:hypothetical protein [Planctomycetota bacterium]
MSAPIYVMPPTLTMQGQAVGPTGELADLMRQLIGLQQEQVGLLKAQAARDDNNSKWRAFLSRWESEYPGIGGACKQVLPQLEREYLELLREVTDKLGADPDAVADEFALAEFLDRYGTRLAQLGNLVSQLAPLADAAPAADK